MDDVNQSIEGAESSAEPTNEINEGQGLEPSAETLNAEPRGPVPYDRFQEKVTQYNDLDGRHNDLNGKYQQLEQEIAPYRQNKELYQAYEQLDRLLVENPQEALRLVQQMVQGNGQDQETNQIDPYTSQALQAANQALQTSQNIVLSNYKNDLSAFIESEGIPQDLAPIVESLASQAIGRYNQNPLASYDKASAQKALADVKKFMDSVYNSRQAHYTKQKQQDDVPSTASSGGVPPVKKPEYSSLEDRRARMREILG